MSRITQTLEGKVRALDQRVAELSLERITWEQRARISEEHEVRLDRELRIANADLAATKRELQLTKAALAVSEREIRTKPIAMLVWRRIQSILRGRR